MAVVNESVVTQLQKKSIELRIEMLEMLRDSGSSGHFGGGFSVMDILTVLYFHTMRVDPANSRDINRDRLVLSKGHACCALCPVLAEKGFFPKDLLNTFNLLDSPFGMHPDMNKIKGCDMSTGSLGHGLAVAVGMGSAARYLEKDCRIYAIMGDGEMGEGSVWEAIQIASQYRLDNLCGIIDRNKFSCDGFIDGSGIFESVEEGFQGTVSLEPIDKKLEAFGWHAIRCNGHDIKQLMQVFETAQKTKGKPTMIIADTVKGKGVSFIEDRYEWHYGGFNADQFAQAIDELKTKLTLVSA